ncbi:ADP-ribosylation factor-like protein 14 [Corythoichthys intestinalis]|uniref:ADP-ribosylation factor-like protein 14 n=1 Tax=Corythoichthys intestinalis TaxID=161448 RepID=UPI0025A5FCC1|nr:ADP-ribosylation factor-like protein 14 [Corythoichthys intestinalis]XP_061795872.1 ADP-ribosylation factor-like protein 14 [Nerophis lumbriciformis]
MGQRGSTQPEARVLILGLDNAGKSTILYKLKHNKFVGTVPTVGFNVEMFDVRRNKKKFALTVWDVGGQAEMRRHWRSYHQDTLCVVFVVDSADRSRMPEAKREVENTLKSVQLRGCPFVILANKQDVDGAMTVSEIRDSFDLRRICADRDWFVQPCSASTGFGLEEALRKISHMVKLPSESAATVKENFKDTMNYIKAKSSRH